MFEDVSEFESGALSKAMAEQVKQPQHKLQKPNLKQHEGEKDEQKQQTEKQRGPERKQRGKGQRNYQMTVDPCQECDQMMEEGKEHLRLKRTGKAYMQFANVIRKRHKGDKHQNLTEEALDLVTQSLSRTFNPEIPGNLAKIPEDLYQRIIDSLSQQEKWRQVDILLKEYRIHHGDTALLDSAKNINLAEIISHSSFAKQDNLLMQIIGNMLDSGAVLENEGETCILASIEREHFKLLGTLFQRGANPVHLSLQPGDTPIHAALSIALEKDKGNFSIFNILLDKFKGDPEKFAMVDPSQQDANGDGLFHLVAKMKCNSTIQHATELLYDRKISAFVRNKEGKLPKDYLLNKKNDRRLPIFHLASPNTTAKPSAKKSKKSVGKIKAEDVLKENKENAEELLQYDGTDGTDVQEKAEHTRRDKKTFVMTSFQRDSTRTKIEEMIFSLPHVSYSLFNPKASGVLQRKTTGNNACHQDEPLTDEEAQPDEAPVGLEEGPENKEQFEIDIHAFDNMEWEVECTADVWKILIDDSVPSALKQRVVYKVQQLAGGDWRRSLCNLVNGNEIPKTLRLFETKLSKGSTILWELAIAFSPRLSETADRRLNMEVKEEDESDVRGGRIYSEVIRVWDIVLNLDNIHRCVERIIKSHNRGKECIIQKKLKREKQTKSQKKTDKCYRYPVIYTEADIDFKKQEPKGYQQDLQNFYPPASSNETEYHILKFYSFSSNLVRHVLHNIETKVDFPFRVTDLEHAIINLQSQTPILLLGRSGTGKTTCCEYRLWTQFLSYWTKAIEADAPLLPRCLTYKHHYEDEEEDGKDNKYADIEEDDNAELLGAMVGADGKIIVEEEDEEEQIYDHLHQIFITKNAVLCSEVQKNFRELSYACDSAKKQVEKKEQILPPRLQDVDDFSFPLFVTSKQLLLMIDASLGQPYFFQRGEDGALKVDIQGWTAGERTIRILPLLAEESGDKYDEDDQFDDEEDAEGAGQPIVTNNVKSNTRGDGDDGEDEENAGQKAATNKVKVDPRREVTYDVFKEEIWPKICKTLGGKYHPSLVWTEIMSFIKGSYEALSKPTGILGEDEYFDLGKKRAPNFSGKRHDIYELFKRYDHFKKQNFLFDETDLVRSVYNRLKKDPETPWVIHQVFVDETQDFTQAELCLLLRICQNPNQMFLTGDTAQSIMRGIAFRFDDLRSLFYYSKQSMQTLGKTAAIEVPKRVHQLTHNYRSHAGILHLASSILDLMVRFFPESFDRLQKDQGLFNGPPPVLLGSGSFSDLVVLLRGNRRKTSHIEFGAHQAILVVDETARNNIPKELHVGLILTIYEAKGLEFDDILLYNFFKDSQAVKEWQVVTEYLEELATITNEDNSRTHQESLVEIDREVLRQSNRPRPLKFDASLHKVLNSELKHLYTAVTRARVNVWIFDEDEDKRAPMFEYFKARKLVKTISSKNIDGESIDGMFAEESKSEDWIKRGEDFMKHALYEVAAKCFIRGGDQHLQKVALAYQQASVASHTKGSQQRMCDEFLSAAKMFLDCSLTAEAAKCLQNARERELVARLFEKIGKLEKAAATYREIKMPKEGSRCYEQLGKFDEAIETLCENEYYDLAIETLWRYNRLKEELKSRGENIPQVLIENAPKDMQTMENLSYTAAEFYHKCGNEIKMMVNLGRLPQLRDRVEFLKRKDLFDRAAELLKEDGEYQEAANLYLIHGSSKEAVATAQLSEDKDLLAECLLVDAQVQIRKKSDTTLTDQQHQEVLENLQTSINILLQKGTHGLRGEACFLKGEITGEITDINESWGAFNKCFPRDEAGQLECMDWMVRNSDLNDLKNLSQVVKGMDNLFGVLNVLVSPSASENKTRADKIFRYYGLHTTTDGLLKMYPKKQPRALHIVKHYLSNTERHNTECQVPKDAAKKGICRYLLDRGHDWFARITLVLNKMRKEREQCKTFALGLECSDEQCLSFHAYMTEKAFRSLIEVDILHLELDWYVQQGCGRFLRGNSTKELLDMVIRFLPNTQENYLARFKSCEVFLQHLMPRHHFPFRLAEKKQQAQKIQDYICNVYRKKRLEERKYMKEQIVGYLKAEFDFMKREERKANTHVFVKLHFLSYYLQLRGVDVHNLMMEFETEIQKEFLSKKEPFKVKKSLESQGFLVEHDNETCEVSVQCLARRFYEGYNQLAPLGGLGNPMEALVKFTKFVAILGKRNNTAIFSECSDLFMWLEFFTTVALCFGAKDNQMANIFFLPASYISLVHFIDTSFKSHGQPTFERIQSARGNKLTLGQDRAQRIIAVLCGESTKMNLIKHLFKICDDRHVDYALAERIFVLSLTILCNMGQALSSNTEAAMMEQLCLISLPVNCPSRIVTTVRAVKEAEGLSDIAVALQTLLKERDGEKLCHCIWLDKYGLQSKPFCDLTLIPSKFSDPSTKVRMTHPAEERMKLDDQNVSCSSVTELETEISMEDKVVWENEQKTFMETEKKNKSAVIITNFFRKIQFRKLCTILRALVEETLHEEKLEERLKVLKDFVIDDKRCDVCGVEYTIHVQELDNSSCSVDNTNLSSDQLKTNTIPVLPIPNIGQIQRSQATNETIPKMNELSIDAPVGPGETTDLMVEFQRQHEQSATHQQNLMEFNSLKKIYKKEIAQQTEDIQRFIQKHNLNNDQGLMTYGDRKLQLTRLTSEFTQLQDEFNRILINRDWGNHYTLMNHLHKTIGCYMEVRQYVEEKWQSLQETATSKAAASESLKENEEDKDRQLEDVIPDPSRQK